MAQKRTDTCVTSRLSTITDLAKSLGNTALDPETKYKLVQACKDHKLYDVKEIVNQLRRDEIKRDRITTEQVLQQTSSDMLMNEVRINGIIRCWENCLQETLTEAYVRITHIMTENPESTKFLLKCNRILADLELGQYESAYSKIEWLAFHIHQDKPDLFDEHMPEQRKINDINYNIAQAHFALGTLMPE